jgi:predicted lipoprotein with Yx(FWY)xxD motif
MKKIQERNWLLWGLGFGSTLLVGMTSCSNDEGGLTLPTAGTGGSNSSGGMEGGSAGADTTGDAGTDDMAGAGGSSPSSGGTGGTATGKGGKSGNSGSGNSNGGKGGSANEPDPEAGAAGAPVGASGGSGGGSAGGSGGENQGEAGAGGTPDEGNEPLPLCVFSSAPAPVTGGEGGAPAAPSGIEVATSAFVGPYLTDLAGMTLYIYGADVPGDCNNPPVSNCSADCAVAWPPFDAGERVLDAALDASVFGTLDRGDGTYQTTYYGWPLYYYKSDTSPNTIGGQGKGKTWFAAEVSLPNLMIMRGPVSGGGIKYLSDNRGYTLYALSGDTLGGSGTPPVSACSGDCLDSFAPFAPGDVYPVTSIEPQDVALFFRGDGGLQTAYKGAPLYYSKLDLRPGAQNGLNVLGGALVLP